MKPNRSGIETFKNNLIYLIDNINLNETEEFHKGLVSRYPLETDLRKALKGKKWNFDDHRLAVMTCHNLPDKETKRNLEKLIAGASALGWAISAMFSGWLKLSGRVFLIPYVLLSALFLMFYFIRNETVTAVFCLHNRYWGLLFTALAGVFLVKNILAQPHSQTKRGMQLLPSHSC